jgi:hypothetical protein
MAKYERLSTFVVSVVAIVCSRRSVITVVVAANPIRHEIKITG